MANNFYTLHLFKEKKYYVIPQLSGYNPENMYKTLLPLTLPNTLPSLHKTLQFHPGDVPFE